MPPRAGVHTRLEEPVMPTGMTRSTASALTPGVADASATAVCSGSTQYGRSVRTPRLPWPPEALDPLPPPEHEDDGVWSGAGGVEGTGSRSGTGVPRRSEGHG